MDPKSERLASSESALNLFRVNATSPADRTPNVWLGRQERIRSSPTRLRSLPASRFNNRPHGSRPSGARQRRRVRSPRRCTSVGSHFSLKWKEGECIADHHTQHTMNKNRPATSEDRTIWRQNESAEVCGDADFPIHCGLPRPQYLRIVTGLLRSRGAGNAGKRPLGPWRSALPPTSEGERRSCP